MFGFAAQQQFANDEPIKDGVHAPFYDINRAVLLSVSLMIWWMGALLFRLGAGVDNSRSALALHVWSFRFIKFLCFPFVLA